MLSPAECAREWFTCAYDLFDRLPGPFARQARDRVWDVSASISDDASREACDRAAETVLEVVRGLYITTDRLTAAVAVLWRDYVADGVAEECDLASPADAVRYARDVLTLPGHRGVGGYSIDYCGSESDIAFVTLVAASDAAVSDALSN